jgi:hypothetical protein
MVKGKLQEADIRGSFVHDCINSERKKDKNKERKKERKKKERKIERMLQIFTNE